MKDLDHHPEVLLSIVELYNASTFCMLRGRIIAPMATQTAQGAPPPLMMATTASYGYHQPAAAALAPSIPVLQTIPPQAQPVALQAAPPINQTLPFAPGLCVKDYSVIIANAITEKLTLLFNNNYQSAPQDCPLQNSGNATSVVRGTTLSETAT